MHFAPGPADGFEPWEIDLIASEAAVFERRGKLRWSEREDLVAEAQISWWLQRRAYDPGRGASKETLLKLVVRHALADVAKAERAQSRAAAYEALSLDAPLDPAADDLGEVTLHDVIANGDDNFSEVDFEVDIGAVLRRLTPRQQEIVRGRLRGDEMKAISERLGVHRDTLYQDLKQIRATFRAEGLLEPDPTDRLPRSQREAGGLS